MRGPALAWGLVTVVALAVAPPIRAEEPQDQGVLGTWRLDFEATTSLSLGEIEKATKAIVEMLPADSPKRKELEAKMAETMAAIRQKLAAFDLKLVIQPTAFELILARPGAARQTFAGTWKQGEGNLELTISSLDGTAGAPQSAVATLGPNPTTAGAPAPASGRPARQTMVLVREIEAGRPAPRWTSLTLAIPDAVAARREAEKKSRLEREGQAQVEALVKGLASTAAEQRSAAIDAFVDAYVESDAEELHAGGLAPLLQAVTDEDDDVRAAAAWALESYKRPVALRAVAPLAKMARSDPYPEARRQALIALRRLGPPGRVRTAALLGPDLSKSLPPDPEPAEESATASTTALAAVESALADEDPDVRKEAVHAAGTWGAQAAGLASRIAPFLRDPDEGTRYVATVTARQIGAPASLVLDGLVAIAKDAAKERVTTRRVAILLLRDLGEPARAAVPALRSLKSDPQVAEAVGMALEQLDPQGK